MLQHDFMNEVPKKKFLEFESARFFSARVSSSVWQDIRLWRKSFQDAIFFKHFRLVNWDRISGRRLDNPDDFVE